MMCDLIDKSTTIDLETIITIVSSLQRVVADFYGPQCTQTLLTSNTGKAVVTSDGFSILEALQPSHPLSQIVFKALKSCHSMTLDGCKTFLIYLANFLIHLQEEISQGSFCHHGISVAGNKQILEKQGVVCARKYMRKLKQDVLPKLCENLKQYSAKLAHKMMLNIGYTDVLKSVLHTALMPHFNPKICEHFAELLVSSLPGECQKKSFEQTLEFLIDKFFDINIKVSEKPFCDSTMFDPFLLNRDFTLKCDNILTSNKLSVMIIKGSLDGNNTDEESSETFFVKHAGQITNLIKHRRKMAENFAYSCFIKGIHLILCTQSIPGYAVDSFRQNNISVIANVSENDVDLLEILTGKLSLNNVTDCIDDINIIQLTGVCELVVGGRKYIQLKVDDTSYLIKHLIVCAPTIGLCDQLAITLQKALNALKMCVDLKESPKLETYDKGLNDTKSHDKEKELEEENVKSDEIVTTRTHPASGLSKMIMNLGKVDFQCSTGSGAVQNDMLSVIQGGASFEILVAKLLNDFCDSCTDPNLVLMCQVLERTLISLVKKLYENTNTQSESTRGFLEVKTVLGDKISGGEVWGIDRRGVPSDMLDKGVVEPLKCKIHILYCVLDLVEQLLGIDKIVSVRKLDS